MKRLRSASFSRSRSIFRLVAALGLAASFGLGVTGCDKGGLSVHDSGEFQAASPEVKSQWQTAVEAAKTNGYLVAYTTLQKLQAQPGLTAGQSNAVVELSGVVGTRMFNAANNGDPEATKALKEVQDSTKRR
jgi:hypothetical protein